MTVRRKPYLVAEVSITLGTANLVLSGSLQGHRTFGASLADGSNFTYYVEHESLDEWEVGEGSYAQGANSLVRPVQVETGSNGVNPVSFSAGNKLVYLVDDNRAATYVACGNAFIGNANSYPDIDDDTVVAIGPYTKAANGGARSVVIGEEAKAEFASEGIAIGSFAETSSGVAGSTRSVAIGSNATTKPFGSSLPEKSVALGVNSTAYLAGMAAFAGGGESGTELTRLTTQTTDATPKVMALDDGGTEDNTFFQPMLDGRAKTIGLEVHVVARNTTDNDAAYFTMTLLGHWDGANFVQISTTSVGSTIQGPTMGAATAVAAIANDRLEVTVTGIAAKTIRWAGTVLSSTLWHNGVPGS